MGLHTGIEWTDATWNPWHGCHKISPGCKNCYMFRDKARYGDDPNVVVRSKTKFREPLKWPAASLIFTCSWSDWLIEEADPWRDEAYDVIRQTPRHTYQILTKRIDRAAGRVPIPPLPNVWLGVSVEDQATADARIPLLLQTPASVRFVSYEPALGPVDFTRYLYPDYADAQNPTGRPALNWIIAGGESGPGARPSNPDWFRTVRDQCQAAGIPFFFKQWGEHYPLTSTDGIHGSPFGGHFMSRVGKKKAGRTLDGKEWLQFPPPEVHR